LIVAIVNITTQTDADFYRSFALQTTSGAPIDMTGGTLEMMLRRHAQDEAAVLRLGTDTGEIVLTDAVNGQFTVRIAQDRLVRLGLGDFDQSNIMTRGGYKYRVWSGTLTNNPGPTR
jgi:hypothetical protein